MLQVPTKNTVHYGRGTCDRGTTQVDAAYCKRH